MIENFIELLTSQVPLSEECIDNIKNTISILNLKKDEHLVEKGEQAPYLYFISKGIVRVYYIKDGKDITDWLASENQFISSLVSLFTKKPSDQYVQVLEDTQLIAMSHNELEKLYDKYHSLERIGRLITTQNLLRLQERVIALQFYSAKEKYELLLKNNPQIIQRVSLTHIASFLGITLETLSRVRGQ